MDGKERSVALRGRRGGYEQTTRRTVGELRDLLLATVNIRISAVDCADSNRNATTASLTATSI